jgi:hypothetical protein
LVDPGVDERIILMRIFVWYDVGVWTGLSWLRIETVERDFSDGDLQGRNVSIY